jgi:hypothetical protein
LPIQPDKIEFASKYSNCIAIIIVESEKNLHLKGTISKERKGV